MTRRLAVLPSGREVEVRAFVDLRADRYLYRPATGLRAVFYTAGLPGGGVLVRMRYRRARRASNG